MMPARDHTDRMLRWWIRAGIDHADLAVRRPDGTMPWHRDRAIEDLPLPWVRAENVRRAEIYIRPARGYPWPLVFLDDVPGDLAARVASKYAALVIRTSAPGGCHVWLRCATALHEDARRHAQRWLASRVDADTGSVSGEHLGRLAGFRNWKRAGVWVNLVVASEHLPPWDPVVALSDYPQGTPRDRPSSDPRQPSGNDTSPSGAEWGWVCGMLDAGFDPSLVHAQLVDRARPRRGHDAQRYATRTIDRARRRRFAPPSTRDPRES
jgi:hypothetical protein